MRLFLLSFLTALFCLLSFPVDGQAAPPRFGGQTMTLLTIEPETGQTSAFYRLFPEFLQKISPDSLILEPKPGLGGATAWHTLQRRRTDGSQMTAITFPAFLLKPLAGETYFTQKMTTPVCVLASAPLGLWVPNNSHIRTVADFLDEIKGLGNSACLAGVGSFTAHHMATLYFNQAAGVTTEYLPFIGSNEATFATREGQATAVWGSATHHSLMPGMRLLAVAAIERSHIYPTTPTLNESGILMAIGEQYAIGLPSACPEETKQAASDLFIQIATDETFVRKAYGLGFSITPAPYKDMQELVEEQEEALRTFLEHFFLMTF